MDGADFEPAGCQAFVGVDKLKAVSAVVADPVIVDLIIFAGPGAPDDAAVVIEKNITAATAAGADARGGF